MIRWLSSLSLLAALLAAPGTAAAEPSGVTMFIRTEYAGPGNYCGEGLLVRLEAGEQVQFIDTRGDAPLLSIEISGGRVVAMPAREPPRGEIVPFARGGPVRQSPSERGGIEYYVGDGPIVLRLGTMQFRGIESDGWFFDRVNFEASARQGVACIRGRRQ